MIARPSRDRVWHKTIKVQGVGHKTIIDNVTSLKTGLPSCYKDGSVV